MAKGRMLNRSIATSEKFANLANNDHRLIATWCIPFLDKNGVMPATPRVVKALIMPMLDIPVKTFDAAIRDMCAVGLCEAFTDGGKDWLHWPGIAHNQGEASLKRESTEYPEPPQERQQQHETSSKDAQSDATGDSHIQLHVNTCNNNKFHANEVNEKEVNEDEGNKKKFLSEQKPPAAAAESEFVKLWREWTIHTGPIAPTFKARIDETVTDLEVWRDTLTFGAKNRRVKHTNDGLDWALANYKTGIAQKRAAGMQTTKPFAAAATPKKKMFIEGVEVYVN